MKYLLTFFIILASVILIPNAFAQESTNIPDWIKNNADWWALDLIDDNSFVSGIQWLVSNDIIQVPSTTVSEELESAIPNWVKNTAGWWADGIISDDDFVNSLQYLIKVGIMVVPQAEDTETLTKKISDYPDWLVNNPSWQAAKEFTDSPLIILILNTQNKNRQDQVLVVV